MSQHKENEFKPPVADVAPVLEDLDGFNCAINPMERLISPWADKTGFSSEKGDLETWLKAGGGKVYPATGETIGNGSRKARRNNNLKLALQYCNDPEKQEKEEGKSGKNLKRIFWIQKTQQSKELANKINSLVKQIVQLEPELTTKEKGNLKKRLIKDLWNAADPPAVSQTTSSSEKQDSKDDAIQAALPEVNNKSGIIKTPIGFTCPLTGDLIKEPYLAADGYSYEKKAIEEYLQKSSVSPVTREKLENKNLVKNWNLFKAIQDFQTKWMSFARHQQMVARVEKEAGDIRAKRAQQKELRKAKQAAASNPLPNLQNNATTLVGSMNVTEQKSSPDNAVALVSVEQIKRAVVNGDLQAVERLFKEGGSADLKPAECRDIFSAAIRYCKDSQIFQYLLSVDDFRSAGIEHLYSLNDGLFQLIGLNCSWTVKDKEAVFAKLSRYGNVPPWFQAACVGNIKEMKKQGPFAMQDLVTMFWCACANGHENIMSLLWELHNPLVNRESLMGDTALSFAARNSQLGAIRYLLDHGAKIEGADKPDTSPLMVALNKNRVDVVKLLLGRGATLTEDSKEIFPKLLMRGVGCSATDKVAHMENLLLSVNFSTQKDMILFLLDYWIKLTKKSSQLLRADKNDADGNAPLMLAALEGNIYKVSSCLRSGAALEGSNKYGQTPLLLAAYGGHAEVVELLLKHGANCNARDMMGMSVLMAAMSSGKTEMVRVLMGRLMEIGAKIDLLYIPLSAALGKIIKHPFTFNYTFIDEPSELPTAASDQPVGSHRGAASSSKVAEQKHIKQGNDACPVIPNNSSFFPSPRKESKEMLQPQFLQKDTTKELQTVKNSASSSEEAVHFSTSEHH